jgi:hypothetical protein
LPDESIGPIGGYFELELPDKKILPYKKALRFQSARAAFLSLLRAGNPKRVWMPKYICNSMLAPLKAAKIKCVWYDVNNQLTVEDNIIIGTDDWILFVNYFGICNKQVSDLLKRFAPKQVVLDYSQSFFTPPRDEALATIYSARKFFGVPDGGLLISQVPISPPEIQDTGSFERVSHLMQRLGNFPEAGYADFQRAEESLTDCEPKKMSKLTERILSSINFEGVGKKRRENFLFLHERLGKDNQLALDHLHFTAPLCYPFLTNNSGLRGRLQRNRIFVATYWSDAISRINIGWTENMVKNLLPLPIDQRYGQNEMERIVSLIFRDRK